jgi:hypothetical protein
MPKWDSNPRSQCWSGRRQNYRVSALTAAAVEDSVTYLGLTRCIVYLKDWTYGLSPFSILSFIDTNILSWFWSRQSIETSVPCMSYSDCSCSSLACFLCSISQGHVSETRSSTKYKYWNRMVCVLLQLVRCRVSCFLSKKKWFHPHRRVGTTIAFYSSNFQSGLFL